MNLSANQTKIVNCLMKTKTKLFYNFEQIQQETGLARTTIINNLDTLVKLEIVERNSVKRNGLKGRPKIIWWLI